VNSVVRRMRAPAVSLDLFATTIGFTLAALPKQFAIQGRIDVCKDILNGFEVMSANLLVGEDGKRGKAEVRIAVIEV
jgi:hypothetical protein